MFFHVSFFFFRFFWVHLIYLLLLSEPCFNLGPLDESQRFDHHLFIGPSFHTSSTKDNELLQLICDYIFLFFSGTRIIYDRKFLLDRRNSPIAQTPPAHLPVIPGVTSQNVLRENKKNEANKHIIKHDGKPATGKCYNIDQEIFLCNRECFVGIVISSPFLLHHVTHTLTLYVL